MLSVKIICVGTLKESYFRDAVAEYTKRLSAYCKLSVIQLKESKVPENPSEKEIVKALDEESVAILSEMSPRSYKIAMCVEGKQLSSEKLAERLEAVASERSEVCFVIGSSHGLSDKVKQSCDMRLSISELTFPYQLLRVILLEAVYRAFNIMAGTKYHK
jgi:23S rRNA (pseudouridine1915-N3)-methyltransferase